jgi:hypothetical protein
MVLTNSVKIKSTKRKVKKKVMFVRLNSISGYSELNFFYKHISRLF